MDSTANHRTAGHYRRLPGFSYAARLAPLLVLSLMLAVPAVYAADEDNERPTASFTFSQSSPVAGERVTFTSTSRDEDGSIASQAWDLDNDGSYDDGTATTASRTFDSVRSYTVRLRVVDNDGASRTTSRTVTVTANGPPVAAFSASPPSPDTGQAVAFSSTSTDPDGRPLLQEWDTDNDGHFDDATGAAAGATYADDGVRRVSLRVTDSGGIVRTTFRDITVNNRAPSASFTASDTDVDTGDSVSFTSTSTDPDGSVASHAWDFDGDGATDATGSTASVSFANDGTRTVTLTVTDDDAAVRSVSRPVTVKNRPPRASFEYTPESPVAGQEVTLSSTSTDRDGSVVQHRWDLDGDGAFDDATGPKAKTTFDDAGAHTVALEVVDDDGAISAPAFESIEVADRPAPPADPDPAPTTDTSPPAGPTLGPVRPRFLDPFPRVRIRGVTSRVGVRLDLLSVRTPGGTRIVVRCKGGGCPWARRTRLARFARNRSREIRMPGFRRRHLRAGAVIEVFVVRRGMIGKYTRFSIRRLRAPLRTDGCTAVGRARRGKCPA